MCQQQQQLALSCFVDVSIEFGNHYISCSQNFDQLWFSVKKQKDSVLGQSDGLWPPRCWRSLRLFSPVALKWLALPPPFSDQNRKASKRLQDTGHLPELNWKADVRCSGWEMAQQLGVLAALAKDPGLTPRAHRRRITATQLLEAPALTEVTNKQAGRYTYIHIHDTI